MKYRILFLMLIVSGLFARNEYLEKGTSGYGVEINRTFDNQVYLFDFISYYSHKGMLETGVKMNATVPNTEEYTGIRSGVVRRGSSVYTAFALLKQHDWIPMTLNIGYERSFASEPISNGVKASLHRKHDLLPEIATISMLSFNRYFYDYKGEYFIAQPTGGWDIAWGQTLLLKNLYATIAIEYYKPLSTIYADRIILKTGFGFIFH